MDGLANLIILSLVRILVVIMLNTVSIFLITNFIVIIVITSVDGIKHWLLTLTKRAQLVCDSPDSLQDETDYLNNVFSKKQLQRGLC